VVQAGQPLLLAERPHPEWTIARANQVNYYDRDDREATAALAACAALGRSWRDKLAARAAGGGTATANDDDRLYGVNRQ
jgi:MOSC domain-containing protein YiiM